MSATNQSELTRLRERSARIGIDPRLTQASTGNSSIKLEDVQWIKASGKWMADAMDEDILIPLDLATLSA
jgi:rhamnose utilization protein RhaD (predicted bifunctional aldolase and dehydrogenase)